MYCMATNIAKLKSSAKEHDELEHAEISSIDIKEYVAKKEDNLKSKKNVVEQMKYIISLLKEREEKDIKINYIFEKATENTLLDIRFTIENKEDEMKYSQFMQESQQFSLYSGTYGKDDSLVWNLRRTDYHSLHTFLFAIGHNPYIIFFKKCTAQYNNPYICTNHDYVKCIKCRKQSEKEFCKCCKKNTPLHLGNVDYVIGAYLGAPCHMLSNNMIPVHSNEPFKYLEIYLTYQSIVHNLDMTSYAFTDYNQVKIVFKESKKMYKYAWIGSNFIKCQYVGEKLI